MSRLLAAVFYVLLFSLSVFAQEKAPKLPDYAKLTVGDWYIEEMNYKGNSAYMLEERFHINGDEGLLMVFYKPLPREKYVILASIDQPNPENNVKILRDREPLFAYYVESEYDEYVFIYEKTRKWNEFYRLWQPRWRLAGRFADPNASESISESQEDVERIERFIEQRYKISWED